MTKNIKQMIFFDNPRMSGVVRVVTYLLVITIMSLIFALRYKVAFTLPNFYAEDGSVFAQNILDHNIISASLTPFNGYLVLGQYLVAGLAFVPYYLFHLSFTQLPLLIAISSCLFLGATAALPFILFRKELGLAIALTTSFLIAFTPMPGSDFAIIGTIGNLKFAFLFWAVLFVIYRNIHYTQKSKVIISDITLLLCIMTNGPTAALLPFILWPYRKDLSALVSLKSLNVKLPRQVDVISALALLGVSLVYILVVYIHGIPKIANYLQAPYILGATDNILHRVTTYAWLYPFSTEMTGMGAVLIMAVVIAGVFGLNRKGRKVFLFGLFAILISTLAFVATRTGISEYMVNYDKTPDQFFYAQTMVFIFISMWVVAPYIRTYKRTVGFIGILLIFMISATPYGSSFGKNKILYENRGDIYRNTEQACLASKGGQIVIPIYPNDIWTFKVDRSIACR